MKTFEEALENGNTTHAHGLGELTYGNDILPIAIYRFNVTTT